MRVTVLIAAYNGGAYLHEAVASVLGQTLRDFELLIVDDASTDGAIETLPPDPRIRVVRNETNIGQVPSLNRGLSDARGAYVARLDADDLMLPSRLQRQVEVLDAEPRVALVGTWIDVVDERGRRWAVLRGSVTSYVDFVNAILVDRIPFGHPSIMFRRDVVLALDGYDASLAPSEDKDLYRRLALGRHEARVVAQPLVRYRRHSAQLSQVQMSLQLTNDHVGQERFLAAIAPRLPARALRLLLAGDAGLWEAPPLEDLESLLADATDRLHLTAGECDAVARAVAARCARTLRSEWTAQADVDPAQVAAARSFASAHGSLGVRASLLLQPLVHRTRPAGALVDRTRARSRGALRRSRILQPARNLARRSRTLRRLYTTVLGFRLDDR